jgi:hypothetical protein
MLPATDGAVGYFETDEENHRTFEVISRALKPGGLNLIQVPNVLYARARLPQRSWIPSSTMIELVEHRWNKKDRYMEGAMIPLKFGQPLENLDKRIEFRQRLYEVDELRNIYASVDMTLDRVFHGNGRPKEPTEAQFEIFSSARKGWRFKRARRRFRAVCRIAGARIRTVDFAGDFSALRHFVDAPTSAFSKLLDR